MSRHFTDTLCAMLDAGEPADPCKAARYRWLRRTAAAWRDAMERSDAAWTELIRGIPDDQIDEAEVPPPPEQAEVDRLWAQLSDVIQKDMWPRALYFGCM